jgi:hypothetical protein
MTEIRRTHFAYCIKEVIPGWFVILNRDYKPLGYLGREWVDYRDYMVKIKGLGPAKAKRLSYKGSTDLSDIMLYNDGCIPTRSPEFEAAYNKRLSILYNLKVDEYAVKPPKPEKTQSALGEIKARRVENPPVLNDSSDFNHADNALVKFILSIVRSTKCLATRTFSNS